VRAIYNISASKKNIIAILAALTQSARRQNMADAAAPGQLSKQSLVRTNYTLPSACASRTCSNT
jgi:DNA-binding phage protein